MKFVRYKNQYGFTLVELLVVILIIGILTAIAVPLYYSNRKSAWNSIAEQGIRQAMMLTKAEFMDKRIPVNISEYPALEREIDLLRNGGISISYQINRNPPGIYWICTSSKQYDNAVVFIYDSYKDDISMISDRNAGLVTDPNHGNDACYWEAVKRKNSGYPDYP